MKLENARILMLEKSMNLGGSSQIVIQMCEVLKKCVDKIVVCSLGGVNISQIEKIGIEHYTIKDISSIKYFVSNCRIISEIIKKEKITVVHTHHRMAALYAQLFRSFCGVEVICSVHGEFYDKKVLTKIAYHGSKLIACGKAVRNNLISQYNIDRNDIFVLQNTVKKKDDYHELNEISKLCSKESFLIGYFGRLSKEKGVDVFIKSLKEIQKEEANIYYIVVGDGYQKEELINLASDLGIKDNIKFLGYRDDPQNIIQQIDVVVLSSYTEGFPLTPIEAFAHGKPVVATAVGGTVDIIKDGYNGILVKPGDSVAIGKAIVALAKDRKYYRRLSEGAIKSYSVNFSYSSFENKLLEIYKEII